MLDGAAGRADRCRPAGAQATDGDAPAGGATARAADPASASGAAIRDGLARGDHLGNLQAGAGLPAGHSELASCASRKTGRAPRPPAGGRGENRIFRSRQCKPGRRGVRARTAASGVVRPWRAACPARGGGVVGRDPWADSRARDRAEHRSFRGASKGHGAPCWPASPVGEVRTDRAPWDSASGLRVAMGSPTAPLHGPSTSR